jgi:hypothetical protein
MASLECIAREIAGSTATLGDVIKANRDLMPRPLDTAVEKSGALRRSAGATSSRDENRPPKFHLPVHRTRAQRDHTVESTEGGTIFTVHIPRVPSSPR